MNYLLYGPDTYRSRQKLREIIDEYQRKAGSLLGMERFDGEKDDVALLEGIAGGSSLFGAKKLIVIERPCISHAVFQAVRDVLALSMGRTDVLTIVWEAEIEGEKKSMFAELEPLAEKKQEFKILEGASLLRWIGQEARVRGVTLSPFKIAGLGAAYARDTGLWAIANALEKQAVAGHEESPQENKFPAGQAGMRNQEAVKNITIFELGDAFFTRPEHALGMLAVFWDRGEDEMRTFGYLVNYARTLLTARASMDMNSPVSPAHKIHPFVVKKASGLARGLSTTGLIRCLTRFAEEDVKIKTGRMRPAASLESILISSLIFSRSSA